MVRAKNTNKLEFDTNQKQVKRVSGIEQQGVIKNGQRVTKSRESKNRMAKKNDLIDVKQSRNFDEGINNYGSDEDQRTINFD